MQPWTYRPARDLGLPPRRRWSSLEREGGLVSTGLCRAWWQVVRAYLAAWHRLEVRGREHLPASPPFVLIANHASHLDALALAAAVPGRVRSRVFPIAAGDVFFETAAVSAFAALLLNALPMWRKQCGRHALETLRRRLVDDASIFVLFPEGTRSRDGTIGPFKPGLGRLVAGTAVPVVPAHLAGCFEAFPPGRRVPRRRPIRLVLGPPLEFAGVANDRDGWQRIASESEAAVRRLAGTPDVP